VYLRPTCQDDYNSFLVISGTFARGELWLNNQMQYETLAS